jgi:hypothetical protein
MVSSLVVVQVQHRQALQLVQLISLFVSQVVAVLPCLVPLILHNQQQSLER